MTRLKELRETFKTFKDGDKMILVILYNEYLLSASEEILKDIRTAYNESIAKKDSSFLGGYEKEIKRMVGA